jgi:hypothetical protein
MRSPLHPLFFFRRDESRSSQMPATVAYPAQSIHCRSRQLSLCEVSQTGDLSDIQEIQTVVVMTRVPGFVD